MLNRTINKTLQIIFVTFTMISFSCSPDQRGLDKSTRQYVESLARTELIRRDEELKKACDSIYNHWYEIGRDSIYALRIREIEQIIGKQ